MEKRQTLFFNGQTLPGMLDYMIWPWIERVETIPKFHPKLPEIIPGDQFPNFNLWIQNMLTRMSPVRFTNIKPRGDTGNF